MVARRVWLCAGIVAASVTAAGASRTQQNAQTKHEDPAPRGAAQARDRNKPGAEHASLAKLAGEYNRVVKFVGPQGAGTEPSTGTARISVVLGGRFLLEESSDTVFGRPVEGLRLYGFDNATGQYQMARMYTMSTSITMMTGTSSDGGKTIDYSGSSETGDGKMPLHARLRRTSDDAFVVTMFTTGAAGKEEPFQETEYSRKK